MPRFEFCLDVLRQRGYEVIVGSCLVGEGVVSAPPGRRAAELMDMLVNPDVRAVVPAWGGELAVDLLAHLDFDALSEAEPTWFVGFSDVSTLLLPLTTRTGIATVHGQNLMDMPYRIPSPLISWLEIASAEVDATVAQGPSEMHRAQEHDNWEEDPTVAEYTFDTSGAWRLLDGAAGEVAARGRLIGGCIETVSTIAGTKYGDVAGFADEHAPEGLIVYIEAADEASSAIARHLWRMRLGGWFDAANAVLVGRTKATDEPGFSQLDAVTSVLGDLDVPIVLDVDCGHVPPQLALVNGALADLTVSAAGASLIQHLVE